MAMQTEEYVYTAIGGVKPYFKNQEQEPSLFSASPEIPRHERHRKLN